MGAHELSLFCVYVLMCSFRSSDTMQCVRSRLRKTGLSNLCLHIRVHTHRATVQIKKRINNKPPGAKKNSPSKNNGGNSGQVMGGTMGGHMHVLAPEDSGDENSGAESYSTSQERRSEMAD